MKPKKKTVRQKKDRVWFLHANQNSRGDYFWTVAGDLPKVIKKTGAFESPIEVREVKQEKP